MSKVMWYRKVFCGQEISEDELKNRKERAEIYEAEHKRKGGPQRVVGPDGKTYRCVKDMYEAYGVNQTTFYTRVRRGYSREDALKKADCVISEEVKQIITARLSEECEDHLGNKFSSNKEMFEYWGINPRTYRNRIERGMSMEEALETPIDNRRTTYTGLNGEVYFSYDEMKKAYDAINCLGTFNKSINRGYSIKAALYISPRHKKLLNDVYRIKIIEVADDYLVLKQGNDAVKTTYESYKTWVRDMCSDEKIKVRMEENKKLRESK